MKKGFLFFIFLTISSFLCADGIMPTGTGTEADPYIIANLDNLLYISTHTTYWAYGKYHIQTADIDASETQNWNEGAGFSPIGHHYSKFKGSYNGEGHTIDSLYIYRPSMSHVALFGYIEGGSIKNLTVTNVNVTGNYNVAGLVGQSDDSTIYRCYNTGYVTGGYNVAGLVGESEDSSIYTCHNTGYVTGIYNIGGLVGKNRNTFMENSYSVGSVTGEEPIGGLVGRNDASSSFRNSFYNYETISLMKNIMLLWEL